MPHIYIPNSDELGAKGENRFGEISADAKLICNSSAKRDRAGWDFYVQFPVESLPAGTTLDKRRLPISCYVQVKTVWARSDRIRLRLSSAERLAKERAPTFIYVFKVNEKLEFVDSYLIHMLDHNLSVVLKKLRQEQAKGTTIINKKALGFLASKAGTRLPCTGSALRKAITDSVSEEPDAYAEKKAAQLKTLGFKSGRRTVSVKLQVSGMDHFVDIFLGLREPEKAEIKAFETRFGIKLPLGESEPKDSPFKITPIPVAQVRIIFRGKTIEKPAVFQGDFFIPAIPDLPMELRKSIVRCPFFEFQIHGHNVSFSTMKPAPELGRKNISDWVSFFRMLQILAGKEGTVTFLKEDGNKFSLPIPSATINEATTSDYVMDTLESAQRLIEMAGLSDLEVEINEIIDSANNILASEAMASQKSGPSALTVASPIRGNSPLPETLKALFVNYIPLGNKRFAYYAIADLIPTRLSDSIEWKSSYIKLEEIIALPNEISAYERFLKQARSTIELPHVVWRDAADKSKIVDEGFEEF